MMQRLQNIVSKSVISSWFSSFGDAGGFGNEIKEVQVSLGGEYSYNDQFAFRAGYFYENKLKATVSILHWVLVLNTMFSV